MKSGGEIQQSAEQSSKRPSRKNSIHVDEEFRSNKGGMKKSLSISSYNKIDGFPPIEEVGKKLYQENLIAFESTKKKKYKVEGLAEF